MRIYYKLLGAHYHMRVFINGAKSGDLCVRESEWEKFRACFTSEAAFISEGPESDNEREWREHNEDRYLER